MQAVIRQDFIGVDDYLSGEQSSDVRHEYLSGAVYAMAGGTAEHHQIALNVAFALRSHLKGKPCRVFVFDFKVRLETGEKDIFYYPDVMVGCDSRDTHKLYLRHPKILVEVSPESTERLDRHEKRSAYQTLESLEEYLIIAQDRIDATLFRRAHGWRPEVFSETSQTIRFDSIGLSLPVAALYEGVQ
jgi:Uma2 family endonuclease